jgi:hypothetical protein
MSKRDVVTRRRPDRIDIIGPSIRLPDQRLHETPFPFFAGARVGVCGLPARVAVAHRLREPREPEGRHLADRIGAQIIAKSRSS